MLYAKEIISRLSKAGAKFTVHTDIAFGRGINGIGYFSFSTYEEFGEDTKTQVTRTFTATEGCLEINEDYVPPKIPWNKSAEKAPYTLKKYVGYDRITYITESIEK